MAYKQPEILKQGKEGYLLQQKRQWVADNPAPTKENFTPSSSAKTKQDIANELKQAKQDYVRQKAKHFKGLPSQYEADLSAAEEAQLNHALTLPFEEYHALVEPDAPKNLSRQGYDALRQERGIGIAAPQQPNPETTLNDRQDTQAAQPATSEANQEIGESTNFSAATGRNAIGANDRDAGKLRGQQATTRQEPNYSQPTGSLVEQKKQWVKDNPPPDKDSFAYSSPTLPQSQKLKEFKAAQKAYVTEKAKAFKDMSNAVAFEAKKDITQPSFVPKSGEKYDRSSPEGNNAKPAVGSEAINKQFAKTPRKKPVTPSTAELQKQVISLGGLSRDAAMRSGFSDYRKNTRLFHKNGKTFDGMAEALREIGFNDMDGENTLVDKLWQSLNGNPQFTPEGYMEHMAKQEHYRNDGLSQESANVAAELEDFVVENDIPFDELDNIVTLSKEDIDNFFGLNDDERGIGGSVEENATSGTKESGGISQEAAEEESLLTPQSAKKISGVQKPSQTADLFVGSKAEQDALEAKQGLSNIEKAKDAARNGNGNGMDGGELFDLEPSRQANLFGDKPQKSAAQAKPVKKSTRQEIYSLLNDKQKKLVDSGTVEIVDTVDDLPASLKQRGKALFHRVWHGSPTDFNRFDYQKVGGMFGKLFGHGLYFSDSKAVADYYKNAVSSEVVAKDGKVYTIDSLQKNSGLTEAHELAIRAAMESESSATWKEDAKDFIDSRAYWVGQDVASKAKALLNSGDYKPRFTGKLYQVDLAPKQEDYLDWDKPIFQQSKQVTKALSGVIMDFIADTQGKSFAEATGSELYEYLSEKKGGDKAASDYLNSLGIPGLRYKADNSPNSPNNYVIFDDKLANIEAKFSINAWHGSPHDHDRFDSSKIGTGEGAQAFGHGLYFTNKREIAEWYKDNLGKIFGVLDGTPETDEEAIVISELNKGANEIGAVPDYKTARDWLSKDIDGYESSELLNALDDLIERNPSGKLYQVELAPEEDELLDWDKPLSEQSEKVKAALKNAKGEFLTGSMQPFENTSGFGLYRAASRDYGSGKAASDYLHSIGIRGIRYKADDGNSDAYNYVIFSDQDITITNKFSKLAGVEALYDQKTDKVYLVAEMLNKDNLQPVAMHELLHRAEAIDPKVKAATKRFEKSLQASFDSAAKGIGTAIEKKAYKRVMEANTPAKHRLEEYRAYIVSEYLKQPKSFAGKILQAIKDFVASIRMALVRHGADFRMVAKLTPADLFALSKYGYQMNSSDIPNGLGKSLFSAEEPAFKKQYRDIEAKYFNADGSKKPGAMLAPNGKPTNLNKQQWVQVRTQAFKDWFGDWESDPENASKVVDGNGEPLVVYHGTNYPGFSKFETNGADYTNTESTGAFFAGTAEMANSYTDQDYPSATPAIYPVFLNIKYPSKVDFDGDNWDNHDGMSSNEYVRDARSSGDYDGVILENINDAGMGSYDIEGTTFAVFDPINIKSASGNTGEFSPRKGDIRYSKSFKDEALGYEDNETNLKELDDLIDNDKLPNRPGSWQSVKDMLATDFVDSTRPFDAWARKIPDQVAAAKMVLAKDRAKRRTEAFEVKAINQFIKPFSKKIDALAKQHGKKFRPVLREVGRYASVRYALEKNQDYLRQDQLAVDEAKAALAAEPNDSALKAALTRAEKKQADRIKAMNEPFKVDPTETALDAGLAGGYNNFTAQHYLDKLEAKYGKQALDDALQPIYDMNEWKVQQDIKNGKVTQEIVDGWFKTRHYVPLTGDPAADENDDPLFHVGSLNQSPDRAAKGRKASLAQNGIDASVEQLRKSAKYHGWVDFKDDLMGIYYGLMTEKTDQGMSARDAAKEIEDETGLRIVKNSPMRQATDNDIIIRKNGQNLVFTIQDKAAVQALKDANSEQAPSLLNMFASTTRLYARFVTQFMLGFAPMNAFMDSVDKSEAIRTRKVPGYDIDMDKVGRDTLKNMANPALFRRLALVAGEGTAAGKVAENTLFRLWNIRQDDADLALIREMIEEGGVNTFSDFLTNNGRELSKRIAKSIGVHEKFLQNATAYNNAFEMVSTFSVYKALREQGVDAKAAAGTALNLMNFGKRGAKTAVLGSLWLFVNPTIQGGHNLAKTLGTKRGMARLGAYVVAGTLLYSLLRAGDDDDELGVNRMDELGNSTLERKVPVNVGWLMDKLGIEGYQGVYAKVPVGFGLPQLGWALATNMVKYADGKQSLTDTMAESSKALTKAFVPVQPSATPISKNFSGWLMQTFSPLLLKPFVNVGLDINTWGNSLTNDKYADKGTAKALQGRDSTPEFYKMIAQELAMRGIDMYPESVREIIKGYAPGYIGDALKYFIDNPAKVEQGRKPNYVLLSRWLSRIDNDELKERLYYRWRDYMYEAAKKESLGKELSPEEQNMLKLEPLVKKLEGSAKGKAAAAKRVEKQGRSGELYRKQADIIRGKAVDKVFEAFR